MGFKCLFWLRKLIPSDALRRALAGHPTRGAARGRRWPEVADDAPAEMGVSVICIDMEIEQGFAFPLDDA